MKRLMLFVALTMAVSGGCKKTMDKLENQGSNSGNQQAAPGPGIAPVAGGGAGGGGGFGAAQAVRGAVRRIETAAELHDLHLFMNTYKLSSGRVPTSQETWAALNQPDGNRQTVKLIQDGVLVLVPNPKEEGLWAYSAEAPTMGGWVLTHNGAQRVTAGEFVALQRQ